MIEINLCVFIVWALVIGKEYKVFGFFRECFFYLMVQCIGSFFLVVCVSPVICRSDFLRSALLCMSLRVKLGLVPLHLWLYNFCECSSNRILWVSITIQKLPFIILFYVLDDEILFSIIWINLILGSLKLLSILNFLELVVFSSIYFFPWIYLFFCLDFFIGMLNFFFYSIFLFYFCFQNKLSISDISSICNNSLITLSLFFLSLPPLRIFFFKFSGLFYLDVMGGLLTSCMFWVFSFITLFGYFSYFFKTSFNIRGLNNSNTKTYLCYTHFFPNIFIGILLFLYLGKLFKLLSSYLNKRFSPR